jgi:hypothetical protein
LNTKEIWRLVPSLAGLIASSYGRLMIVPYRTVNTSGQNRTYGGEPTYGQWDGERFLYTFRGKTYKAHRLICEAFNGPPPKDKNICMHKDENAANNAPTNLQWGTQKENLNAKGFIAYCKTRAGENNPMIKGKNKLCHMKQNKICHLS